MKSSFRSVRIALIVVGTLGVAAVVNGCSAGPDGTEQTGEGNQAYSLRPGGPPPLITISSDTYAPQASSGESCLNYYVPPPTQLTGYDCSFGVQVSWGPGDSAIIWACDSDVSLPGGYLTMSPGGGLTSIMNATGDNPCYGNPHPGYVLVMQAWATSVIGSGNCPNAGCGHVVPPPGSSQF
jgi:hypothetical protein